MRRWIVLLLPWAALADQIGDPCNAGLYSDPGIQPYYHYTASPGVRSIDVAPGGGHVCSVMLDGTARVSRVLAPGNATHLGVAFTLYETPAAHTASSCTMLEDGTAIVYVNPSPPFAVSDTRTDIIVFTPGAGAPVQQLSGGVQDGSIWLRMWGCTTAEEAGVLHCLLSSYPQAEGCPTLSARGNCVRGTSAWVYRVSLNGTRQVIAQVPYMPSSPFLLRNTISGKTYLSVIRGPLPTQSAVYEISPLRVGFALDGEYGISITAGAHRRDPRDPSRGADLLFVSPHGVSGRLASRIYVWSRRAYEMEGIFPNGMYDTDPGITSMRFAADGRMLLADDGGVREWRQCTQCPPNTLSKRSSTKRTDCRCVDGFWGPPGGPCDPVAVPIAAAPPPPPPPPSPPGGGEGANTTDPPHPQGGSNGTDAPVQGGGAPVHQVGGPGGAAPATGVDGGQPPPPGGASAAGGGVEPGSTGWLQAHPAAPPPQVVVMQRQAGGVPTGLVVVSYLSLALLVGMAGAFLVYIRRVSRMYDTWREAVGRPADQRGRAVVGVDVGFAEQGIRGGRRSFRKGEEPGKTVSLGGDGQLMGVCVGRALLRAPSVAGDFVFGSSVAPSPVSCRSSNGSVQYI